ncbi:hypothetical protein JMUB4039_0819 [Leptotrichia trevisanii]|jgi:hypothetical protein|uniref:DUF4280 domain-containing protein n=1 Tax=Leptotrichia trevisanii TaxID=109328 RepID=UPI00118C43CC|nr:DUF4280 domain-containing protein [Leptotrichia trevisanii]BBM56841.1 hypothetical protein JMUB4039_0819 [Leptotrichia trevisanii]
MSGYKYVPDGVFLACNQGTETSNLKITHVKNAHLYNNQLYATDRDVEPVNIGCFGNCRELNTKCKYQKGIWQKVHPTLSVEGAAPILDEISYLECPYKGKITIHFDKASAEAIANKNATEKDGINWGRIGNHLLDKGKGLLQGALLGVAIVGGCALIGGVIGFFGGGGVGAVPGAVAGAKVGMAILTGLGIAATVKSVSDTYKSGERLIESTNKAEDGIIFAIDLSETIIMMLGLKKGIKNFKTTLTKIGQFVGNKINNVLNKNTIGPFGGKISKIIKNGELKNGTKYYVMEKLDGELNHPKELFMKDGKINTENLIKTNNMSGRQLYQRYKAEGIEVSEIIDANNKRGIKFDIMGDSKISHIRTNNGGGTHGEVPYKLFGTSENGKLKIVDGNPGQYKIRGNTPERATIIFTEEIHGKPLIPIFNIDNTDKEKKK